MLSLWHYHLWLLCSYAGFAEPVPPNLTDLRVKNHVYLLSENIWISLPSWATQYQYAELKNQGEIGDGFKDEGFFLQLGRIFFSMSFFLFSFTKGGLCVCWPKVSWIHQQGAYSIQAQFYQEKDCCRIIPWNQEVQLQYLRSSRPGRELKTWAIWGKEAACSVTQLSLRQLLELE